MPRRINPNLAIAATLAGGANGVCVALWLPIAVAVVFPKFWFDGNFVFLWLAAPLGAIVGIAQARYVVDRDVPAEARRIIKFTYLLFPITLLALAATVAYVNWATAK